MSMFNEAVGSIRVRAWLLAASILLLTACTSVAVPTVPVETPAPLTTPSDAALVQPAQPAAAGTAEVLAFTVQESTFLSHIQNAAAEMGAPAAHRYIELSGADGALWQGERLAYADNEVWFLQPRGRRRQHGCAARHARRVRPEGACSSAATDCRGER